MMHVCVISIIIVFHLFQTSCKHYGGDELVCPVCGIVVKPEVEFIPLDKLGNYKPTVRWVANTIWERLTC
jgi:hypothetical protein